MTSDFEEVDDPGEYNQRRRIKAIHDARERVFEQRRRALDLQAKGRVNQMQYRSVLREAVESFILEIEQLLRHYESDPSLTLDGDGAPGASWYLEEAQLGTMTLPPNDEELEFTGLIDILSASDPIVRQWEEEQEPPMGFSSHPEYGPETKERKIQISEEILLNAARLGMKFLSQVGLDLKVNEGQRDHGFNYGDILAAAPGEANEAPNTNSNEGGANR